MESNKTLILKPVSGKLNVFMIVEKFLSLDVDGLEVNLYKKSREEIKIPAGVKGTSSSINLAPSNNF
jgi:hypothetical protein